VLLYYRELYVFAEFAMMSFPSDIVDRLRTVETADDEIVILGDLLSAINSCIDSTAQQGNLEQVLEGQVFESFPAQKTALSKPGIYIDDSCTYVDNLNYLVAYIFARRFGWSEGDSAGDVATSDGCQHRLSVVRRPTVGGNIDNSKSLVDDLRCKTQINEALDKLIAW